MNRVPRHLRPYAVRYDYDICVTLETDLDKIEETATRMRTSSGLQKTILTDEVSSLTYERFRTFTKFIINSSKSVSFFLASLPLIVMFKGANAIPVRSS